MNAISELRVHRVEPFDGTGPAFLVYSWPEMALHEDAARFFAEVASRSAAITHQRNLAYSLSHWLNEPPRLSWRLFGLSQAFSATS